jgi:hypothetical protein
MAKSTTATKGCGCGAEVKSRFLPGHDAKLKSRLVTQGLDGDPAAVKELRKRKWQAHLEKARASRERKAAK